MLQKVPAVCSLVSYFSHPSSPLFLAGLLMLLLLLLLFVIVVVVVVGGVLYITQAGLEPMILLQPLECWD